MCNPIEILRLRKYRNRECRACSAVGDITIIIHRRNILVSQQRLSALLTSLKGRLESVMSEPHTLAFCMKTNFRMYSVEIKQITTADANQS